MAVELATIDQACDALKTITKQTLPVRIGALFENMLDQSYRIGANKLFCSTTEQERSILSGLGLGWEHHPEYDGPVPTGFQTGFILWKEQEPVHKYIMTLLPEYFSKDIKNL